MFHLISFRKFSTTLALTYEAEAEGLSADKILDQVLNRTAVPAKA